MAFSSNFFLFVFLPVVLALHYALPRGYRNHVLLAASLTFYAFDTGWLAALLIVSILFNHFVAQRLTVRSRATWIVFVGAVCANLAPLLYFKYTDFLWQATGPLLAHVGIAMGAAPAIALPIGISFFTFQALSYITDVYARRVAPARRLADFGAYHSMFPQLIAGPIVRYAEVEATILDRRWNLDRMADGAFRFCFGLGKKLILADTMGSVVDPIFKLPPHELTLGIAWFGMLCYTLQIYYDFSGYSDMAIGLGKLLGFDFPENFNQPYRARNITEFWRRWHMTLSRWFRDYVYIPLGGNRDSTSTTYRNLLIVFVLCGLWHGAAYTFLVWGLYHGGLLVTERLYRHHVGPLPAGPFAWLSTLLLLMIGWVFFRSADLDQAGHFLATMFGISQADAVYYNTFHFLTFRTATYIACGLLFALVPFDRFTWRMDGTLLAVAGKATAAILVFFYAVAMLSANSFNPFIYFQF